MVQQPTLLEILGERLEAASEALEAAYGVWRQINNEYEIQLVPRDEPVRDECAANVDESQITRARPGI